MILSIDKIHKEDTTVLNIYAPNIRGPKYMQEKQTKLGGEIDCSIIIAADFNAPLSTMDRIIRQKISKEADDLNSSIDQLDLTDMYRTPHPTTRECTFLTIGGTFSRIDLCYATKQVLIGFKRLKLLKVSFLITTE